MKILGVILLIIAFFGPFMLIIIWHSYIPNTSKLRIAEKKEGIYTYYRAEIYRPFFGWTGFLASKYNGNISINPEWSTDKSDTENNILTYKNLKNIK